ALTVFLLSLLGVPPLAGFAAKFQVFVAAVQAGDAFRSGPAPWIGYTLYALVAVGLINTVFGAVYYLRVVRVMLLERPTDEAAALDRLAAFLQSRRVPLPGAGAFPQAFTAMNYVNVRSVMPRLVAGQERELAELERGAAALSNEWRAPAAELLSLKRANLDQ